MQRKPVTPATNKDNNRTPINWQIGGRGFLIGINVRELE
jgi:hypothetical protein